MMLFTILLLLSYINESICENDCYKYCVCNNTRIECNNKNLGYSQVVYIAKLLPINTTSFSLRYNYLSEFPLKEFQRLPVLKELYLSNNLMDKFPGFPDALSEKFPSLKIVDVSSNQIVAISPSHLKNLTYLEKLYASSNKIDLLRPKLFTDLGELIELRLDRNAITSVPVNIFSGLKKLKHLDLSRNAIKILYSGTLKYFEDISLTISLENNLIDTIPTGIFDGFKTFRNINLRNNRISIIENNAFDGVNITDRGTGINLISNFLTNLPVAAFEGMVNGVVLLFNNLVECNCKTYKLLKAIDQNHVRLSTTCAGPWKLKDKDINSFLQSKYEVCPMCMTSNSTNCNFEQVCYTCNCTENGLFYGNCLQPDESITKCNCTTTGNDKVPGDNNGKSSDTSTTNWIIIIIVIIVVIIFIMLSIPMHIYCRRSINKRQLKKLSLRKRLLSKSSGYDVNPEDPEEDEGAKTPHSGSSRDRIGSYNSDIPGSYNSDVGGTYTSDNDKELSTIS